MGKLIRNRFTVHVDTIYNNFKKERECTGCYTNYRSRNYLLCADCRFRGVVYRVSIVKSGLDIYDNDAKFERHLRKRQQIMEAHEKGKLSNRFYTYKNGKRYLSPHALRAEGF